MTYIFKQPRIGGEVRWHQDATYFWTHPITVTTFWFALERLDNTAWPSDTSTTPLEVEAGTLVIFHGLLPHYSAPNRSTVSRHAYTLHAVDANAIYSPLNWLQRPPHSPARSFV